MDDGLALRRVPGDGLDGPLAARFLRFEFKLQFGMFGQQIAQQASGARVRGIGLSGADKRSRRPMKITFAGK